MESDEFHKLRYQGQTERTRIRMRYKRGMKSSAVALLMMGDGITWMMCIRFPFTVGKGEDVEFLWSPLRDEEVEFLQTMPKWVGWGVEQD